MWNIEKVIKELNKISDSVGDTFNIPVKINGRLTRTLGRVSYHYCGDTIVNDIMEFSRQFLETSTDESIISVIQHEWAHYMVNKETGVPHGHDATFKAMCARIGCTNDKTKTKVERTVSASSIYKYQIYCPTCDEFIGEYSRMCSTLKNIDHCYCKKCNQHGLVVIQNW